MARFNWDTTAGGRGPMRREHWEPDPSARPVDDDVIVRWHSPDTPGLDGRIPRREDTDRYPGRRRREWR